MWLMPTVTLLALAALSAVAVPMTVIALGTDSAVSRAWTAASLILAAFLVLMGGVVSWTSAALQHPDVKRDPVEEERVGKGETIAVLILVAAAILGGVVLFVSVEDANRPTITEGEFRSVKIGSSTGNTRQRVESRFGEPQTQADIDDRGIENLRHPGPGLDCLYYNRKGEFGALYQFCFDTKTQRVKSKAKQ
jgi:hypothetical protein